MIQVRVKLIFPESLVRTPILARLVRQFDVEPNIRRADVEEDPLTVRVTTPYAFDLSGTIVAVSPAGFSLRLGAQSALAPLVPSLAAGSLVTVTTGQGTVVAGLGANAPAGPAVGVSAQVQGTVQPDGSVAADHVALSQ